jgi:hypothetical protein
LSSLFSPLPSLCSHGSFLFLFPFPPLLSWMVHHGDVLLHCWSSHQRSIPSCVKMPQQRPERPGLVGPAPVCDCGLVTPGLPSLIKLHQGCEKQPVPYASEIRHIAVGQTLYPGWLSRKYSFLGSSICDDNGSFTPHAHEAYMTCMQTAWDHCNRCLWNVCVQDLQRGYKRCPG